MHDLWPFLFFCWQIIVDPKLFSDANWFLALNFLSLKFVLPFRYFFSKSSFIQIFFYQKIIHLNTYCSQRIFCQKVIIDWQHYINKFKARGGGPGSKKQVWLILKSNLSLSCYFLQNCKIFVYDKNMTRQSSGILLIFIQNIGG